MYIFFNNSQLGYIITYMNKTTDTINTWWAKGPAPGNFGDIMTPYIIEELYNHRCVFSARPFKVPTLMGAGSIVSQGNNKSIIWGSGLIDSTRTFPERAKYLAVRGPHTHAIVKKAGANCPEVFGDPVLLMPRLYSPDVKPIHKYGIFAHYVDTELVTKWYGDTPDVKIINPLNHNPLQVVRTVLECERIISSSLHGVIVAHAYGVPAVWVKHSSLLNGDDIKFRDYFDSVGLKPEFTEFRQPFSVDELKDLDYQVGIDINLTRLVKSLQDYLNERAVSSNN